MNAILLERDSLASANTSIDREWLVTNGLGGYASGTLSGCNTRRYHGLLVAALRPPVERTVMVAKLDATIGYLNRTYALGTNEYTDGTIDPRGDLHLHSFRLDGVIPVWTWSVGDALIEQRIWMTHGQNTTYVSYTVVRSSSAIDLELAPLCTYRDYHWQVRGERNFFVSRVDDGIKIDAHWGAHPYRILVENANIDVAPAWYWNFKHRAESERGLDYAEDLFRPALIRSRLSVGDSVAVVLTAEPSEPMDSQESLRREQSRQQGLLAAATKNSPLPRPLPQGERESEESAASSPLPLWQRELEESVASTPLPLWERSREARERSQRNSTLAHHSSPIMTYMNVGNGSHVGNNGYPRVSRPDLFNQLILAADQFIVERRDGSGTSLGKTVIAGYPWFSDWGRDTMIALPGLTLATRRYDSAASILRTFAQFVSEGMLPNRFPDAGETPEYNTVDATLWYFVAVDEYFRATGDVTLLKDLYPILHDIIDWHLRGTRYGIRADVADGLLYSGEAGVQLTWMDAKIGDWVVTPRTGKAVEINALWFNALRIMQDMAQQLGDRGAARGYGAMAERAHESFNRRFWNGAYLFDVIDSPDGDDASLRPNQLFAASLRHSLLDDVKARAVVDICASELWTPVGMRSLGQFRDAPLPSPLPQGEREPDVESASSPLLLWDRSTEGRERVRNPDYVGRYVGGPRERDAVYHQGTVWSWLLGPFVAAHYRVYGDADLALSYLDGIGAHLREGCIGQVSEIFDGDAPFTPRGCFAQAWGVSEVLRAWSEINERESKTVDQSTRRRA